MTSLERLLDLLSDPVALAANFHLAPLDAPGWAVAALASLVFACALCPPRGRR